MGGGGLFLCSLKLGSGYLTIEGGRLTKMFRRWIRIVAAIIFLGVVQVVEAETFDAQKLIAYSNHFYYETPLKAEEYDANIAKEFEFITYLESRQKSALEPSVVADLKQSIAKSYSRIGLLYSGRGNGKSSLAFYQKAYALAPTSSWSIAFDVAVELASDSQYAYAKKLLNVFFAEHPDKEELVVRQLMLMDFREENYGVSAKKGLELIEKFPKSSAVNYTVLYYFLSEVHLGNFEVLKKNPFLLEKIDETAWPSHLVKYFLGKMSAEDVVLYLSSLPEDEVRGRLCEALYYVGEFERALGNKELARSLFQKTLDMKVEGFVEHHMAKLRLGKGV